MISGLNPFNVVPNWTIDNVTLQVVPSIKYLGTILNGNQHIENRKQAAQKAFYSLQAAGLKYEGVSPYTAGKIYKTAVQTVMSYGCSSVHLTQSNLKELDTLYVQMLKRQYYVNLSKTLLGHVSAFLTREGFLRKNIVAVSFFQNCAIHPYSYSYYISFPLNEIIQA